MRTVTFETESAVFHFSLVDVIDRLNFYASRYGVDAAIKIRRVIESSSSESIKVPAPDFGYLVLDLLREGKGTILCKACQKTYQPRELRSTHIGSGTSPFEVNLKEKGGIINRLFGKKVRRMSMRGGEKFVCPEGHDLISMITWVT